MFLISSISLFIQEDCREHDRFRREVWAVYWVNGYNNKKCIVFYYFISPH
jgi:hypothetical protein